MKWVYERWTPKWPEPLGGRMSISGVEGQPFNYDGTTSDSKEVRYMSIGTVFRALGSTTGVHLKNSTSQATRYLSEQLTGQNIHNYPLPLKDTLIDTIEAEEGTVPDDGVHSDQIYYVKLKPAFPTMRILRDGQWAEVETGYVLKDGVWKPIEEIYKLQDGQWVQA